jgi:hypothetical protein
MTIIGSLAKGTRQVALKDPQVEVALGAALGVAFTVDGTQDLYVHDTELGNLSGACPINGRKPWKSARFEDLYLHDVVDGDALHLSGNDWLMTNTVVRRVRIENVRKGPKGVHADGISCMNRSRDALFEDVTLRNARALFLPPQNGQTTATGSEQAATANAHFGLTLRRWTVTDGGYVDIFSAPGLRIEDSKIDDLQLQRLQGAAGGKAPAGSTPQDGTRDVVMQGCHIGTLQVGGENAAAKAITGGVTFSPESFGNTIGKITGTQKDEEAAIRAILERPAPTPDPDPVPAPVMYTQDQLDAAVAGAVNALRARVLTAIG